MRGRWGEVGGGDGVLEGVRIAQLRDRGRGGDVVRTQLATVGDGVGRWRASMPLGVVALVGEHGNLVVRHAAVPL